MVNVNRNGIIIFVLVFGFAWLLHAADPWAAPEHKNDECDGQDNFIHIHKPVWPTRFISTEVTPPVRRFISFGRGGRAADRRGQRSFMY